MGMNGEITLVSNKGRGSSRTVKIVVGMSAQDVFYAELGIEDPSKYSVLVDGEHVKDPSKHKLKDGAFVVIVPLQIKGN